MIEFAIALLTSVASVPGLLLALALAPWLTGRIVAMLAVIDLWLLLEVSETLARPAYLLGSEAGPRLLAAALQVALATAVFRRWDRLRPQRSRVETLPLPQRALPRRRPLRPEDGTVPERAAA